MTKLKKIIRNQIKESFDWVINDVNPFLEIGDPVQLKNPKKVYRIHWTHAFGEGGSVWSDNHIDIGEQDVGKLIHLVKTVDLFNKSGSDQIHLIRKFFSGEDWALPKDMLLDLKKTLKEEGLSLDNPNDKGEITDILHDWLWDHLSDYGLLEYDNYDDTLVNIERWKVTYFDEFGVEHEVKVNQQG